MKFKLVFAVAMIALATACGGSKTEETHSPTSENLITRNWVLESFETPETGMKEAIASLSTITKGKMAFDIRENNKVTVSNLNLSGNQEISEGQWTLSQDSKILTVDMANGKKEYQVTELGDGKMKLKLQNEEVGMVFVPKD